MYETLSVVDVETDVDSSEDCQEDCESDGDCLGFTYFTTMFADTAMHKV